MRRNNKYYCKQPIMQRASGLSRFKAFTLAEVLITMGIIGLVAALTIPNFISSYREKQTIAKLKKVYSTFSNAYKLVIYEYGTPDTWDDVVQGPVTESSTTAFFERLKPYLQISKECDFNNRFNCWDSNTYFKYLNGSESRSHIHNGFCKTFILNDGTRLAFYLHETKTKPNPGCLLNGNYFSCATLIVKTDNRREQIFGKNIFLFQFEHNRIVPSGQNKDMKTCTEVGETCTAWAIFNENLDYIKCDDLSWNGKQKCN